jgi:hypothetical protein
MLCRIKARAVNRISRKAKHPGRKVFFFFFLFFFFFPHFFSERSVLLHELSPRDGIDQSFSPRSGCMLLRGNTVAVVATGLYVAVSGTTAIPRPLKEKLRLFI